MDPLNQSTLLYSAKQADQTTYAVIHNWRTDKVLDRFEIPKGTHDIDYLGDGEYVLTDGINDRVIVMNRTTNETIWEYDFTEHFPPNAGGGNSEDYTGDYTHLNDVDAVNNDSAFLVSPRNFDRVMLIDRETKEVIWTLGAEDDYKILYQQHNPELLDESPPTVLVADSENDRAVEYYRMDGKWTMALEYSQNLEWPRDADRLPNGNTLIVDSRAAMEVTPSREIVWRTPIPKFLYDIEVIDLSDEPGGPSMVQYRDEFGSASHQTGATDSSVLERTLDQTYNTAQWVLPWWVSKLDLITASLGTIILLVWASFEFSDVRIGLSSWPTRRVSHAPTRFDLVVVAVGVLLGQVALAMSVASGVTFDDQLVVQWSRWNPFYHAAGILTLLEGTTLLLAQEEITLDNRVGTALERTNQGLAVALVVLGISLFALGVGLRPDNVQISSLEQVFSVAAASLILGSRRLLAWVRLPSNRMLWWSPRVRGVVGLTVVCVAIGILVGGMQSLDLTGGFLGLGLLLAFIGSQWVKAAARSASAQSDTIGSSILRGSWYVLRIGVAMLAVGVFLRMIGLGTIGGLKVGPNLLNPMYSALLMIVLETAAGPLGEQRVDSMLKHKKYNSATIPINRR